MVYLISLIEAYLSNWIFNICRSLIVVLVVAVGSFVPGADLTLSIHVGDELKYSWENLTTCTLLKRLCMLKGLNHITIAVSDVSRSFDFYVNTLGFIPKARWTRGAYLCLGNLWLCLSADAVTSREDYTHYAFSIRSEDFDVYANYLKSSGVTEWKTNKSEGKSLYFLDPDGHKLEVHDGDLDSRLSACKNHPYEEMEFFSSFERAPNEDV